MLGAIIGDIVGSIYEFDNIKTKDFNLFSPRCFFTDDTVMTIAVYKALKKSKLFNYKNLSKNAVKYMQKYGKLFPNMSYGSSFNVWLNSKKPQPYNSYGNGSAMRISAVPYFAKDIEQVKQLSNTVSSVSHNHEEGIKGAEATAVAIYLALNKKTKEQIKSYIENNYYKLDFDYNDLVKNYKFNETCQNTVPQAIYCFLISNSFEDCLRTSISIGGDSDTLCAISCAIAEAYYGIPEKIEFMALRYLDERLLKDYKEFERMRVNEFMKLITNEKLLNLVREVTENNEKLVNVVFDIVMKIKNLRKGTTTTIAKLINYDAHAAFVEPLTQSSILRCVEMVCKRIGVVLELESDSFGGLAYHYEFKIKKSK